MSWWSTLRWRLQGVRVHPTTRIRTDGTGGVELDAGAWLARDCEIETSTRVRIGARTTIQRRCTINGTTRVGADCIFAPDVFVSSGTHPFREIAHLPIREQERHLAAQGVSLDRPVWIQDDCWLGTHAVVAPGVTIGKGSVVGANSVVTKDVPPYAVVGGAPARVIGQRLAWTPPARVDMASPADQPYVLSTDDPLLVALRRPVAGERIRIVLRCSREVRLTLNGEPVTATPSTRELFAAPVVDLPFAAAVRIDGEDFEALAFQSFEVVAA